MVDAQDEVVAARIREFRRSAKATVHWICVFGKGARSLGRHVFAFRCLASEKSFLEDSVALEKLFDLLAEFVAVVLPGLTQPEQDPHKPRPAIAILRREVRSAEEGFSLRGHEHRQRPAASLAHDLDDLLIGVVDVGSLLAIDLDVDEPLVHQARDVRILERLVGHHMTPVAGGVPHRQVDRLVLFSGSAERVLSPWIPIDRVLGVLPEIRRGFLGQSIRHPYFLAATCSMSPSSSTADRPPDVPWRNRPSSSV